MTFHFPLSWQNKTRSQLQLHTILAPIKANRCLASFFLTTLFLPRIYFCSVLFAALISEHYHLQQKWQWPIFGGQLMHLTVGVSGNGAQYSDPIIKFQNFHSSSNILIPLQILSPSCIRHIFIDVV